MWEADLDSLQDSFSLALMSSRAVWRTEEEIGMWFIVAISWLALSFGVSVFAGRYGRGPYLWFWISIFLSPLFSIIMILLLGNVPIETSKEIVYTRKCPYCAEKILAEAKICKHCGREVKPLPIKEFTLEPRKSNPPEQEAKPVLLDCPHCGRRLGENKSYCHVCQKDTGY